MNAAEMKAESLRQQQVGWAEVCIVLDELCPGWITGNKTGVESAITAIRGLKEGKDDAYKERNQLVAALTKVFPSGTAKTAIEGWSEDWHGCVYVDLPTGQCSWHYHDSHAYMFSKLPAYTQAWDGHTTDQKYERLRQLPTTWG